jgi:alpha-mannosidase
VPSLRFADLGDGNHGLSLINESKYGYDALGNTLRLTLLRSPAWPDPEADRGHHHFRYALYPHAGDVQQALSVRRGYDYNYPLQVEQVLQHEGSFPAEHSFITVKPANIVLTAVKKAEDANALILHLYEWAGKETETTITLPPGATSAEMTDLMENSTAHKLSIEGNSVTVPVGKFAIESLRVDYPANEAATQ